jgi:cytochrome c oxidase subunit II
MNRRIAGAVLLLVLCLCSLAQAGNGQSMTTPLSDQARSIDGIWRLMLWVCGAVYVLVLLALGAAVVHGRRNALRAAPARRERGVAVGLVMWTVVIGLILAGLSTASFLVDRELLPEAGEAALRIRITGHQWWWQVEYPDADPSRLLVTANQLHLPLGRPVRLELASADVIHSLWIPALQGKRDLIPGRRTELSVTAREAGRFRAQCAEFCGLQHAHMAMEVAVDPAPAFEAWRAQQLQPAGPPRDARAQQGLQVFLQRGCGNCHTVRGTPAAGRVAPDLTHLAARRLLAAGSMPFNRGWLAAWIADPQQRKPGNHMPVIPLEPAELDALLAYLTQLQ